MNLRCIGFSVEELPEGFANALRIVVNVAVTEEIQGEEVFLGLRRVDIELSHDSIPEDLSNALVAVTTSLLELVRSRLTEEVTRERQDFPKRFKGLEAKARRPKSYPK